MTRFVGTTAAIESGTPQRRGEKDKTMHFNSQFNVYSLSRLVAECSTLGSAANHADHYAAMGEETAVFVYDGVSEERTNYTPDPTNHNARKCGLCNRQKRAS